MRVSNDWHNNNPCFHIRVFSIGSLDIEEWPNACLQATLPRPDDGQHTVPKYQAVMREAYAEIAERGWGRLQGFVSNPFRV